MIVAILGKEGLLSYVYELWLYSVYFGAHKYIHLHFVLQHWGF